jgi:pyrroloquinoline quinone (PQQ) biosynthesis protein C
MAIEEAPAQAVPGDEYLEELEELRRAHLHGRTLRRQHRYATKEDVAEAKRRLHGGAGDHNHKFEGERYLNCLDKTARRFQLRKLIDEGGQTTVGVGLPSHPMLARWESYEFGLTDEEIDRLEKEDLTPERLIWQGWRTNMHRTAHWAVAIGSSLVGEGEKRNPEVRRKLLEHIEVLKEDYRAMGIQDVDRALASAIEHAGVDVEHAEFGASVVREFVDTPELQEELRKAFILTLHQNGY